MKNVWKGLAVGALVGAAVGVILDALEGTGRRRSRSPHPRRRGRAIWPTSLKRSWKTCRGA